VYRGFWLETWLKSLSEAEQEVVMAATMKALADGTMTPDIGGLRAGAACRREGAGAGW
jgi:hypothetical protein